MLGLPDAPVNGFHISRWERSSAEPTGGTPRFEISLRGARRAWRLHMDEGARPAPAPDPSAPAAALRAAAADIVEAMMGGPANYALVLERPERPLPAGWEDQRGRQPRHAHALTRTTGAFVCELSCMQVA